jgi:GT2 family glycosyltransferase
MNGGSPSPSIALIVLNWNGGSDTLECLASLRRSTVPLYVIVVDNGSQAGEFELIQRSGLADSTVATGANLGYAEGNNVGLRLAIDQGFSIIGVLNNDTVIEAGSFRPIFEYLTLEPRRAVSPDIRYFDRPSESWFAGGVIELGYPRHLQPDELSIDDELFRRSDCLSGCCIVARRETWQQVGLFDPRYFLIFEDSDWSVRARRQGVGLRVARESVIMHKVSRSLGSGPSSLLGDFYFVRNGLRFVATYSPRDLPAFVIRWLVRPSLSGLLHRRELHRLGFRWLGFVAFACRANGGAPKLVERLARNHTQPSSSG